MPEHFGAHDIAPNAHAADPFRGWPRIGLDPPGITIADDLSNLDEIIALTRRQFQ